MSKWEWKQKISREIFEAKYCLHHEKSPEEVFRLISEETASVETDKEKWAGEFYNELVDGRLIPAGRILANARPESKMKNYNNCFTIDIEDSMEGIYESLKEDAAISKMGGGVGFDISKLRPKGAPLSSGSESSGVISFLRIFDQSAKTIMTGGQRRSAHIALLDISHPEIEDFITVKKGDSNGELTQFNISVKVSDDFIQAVKNDDDWDLVFDGRVYKTVKARYLYEMLAKNAYTHNEPGIFYADTVERFNNGYWAFKMDRVNPCGELVMPPYSLCCLSAINLTKYIDNPFTDNAVFNFEQFAKTVSVGVRFLDNILDVTEYPLEKIETFSKQWRRIGLGITGLGDAFTMLGVKYGSRDSKDIVEEIAATLRNESYLASAAIAAEKGTFPAYDEEKYLQAEFIKNLPEQIRSEIKKNGIRNVQMNTIAPTGTTSLSVGQNCSSGIEPIFALTYNRTIRTGVADQTVTEEVSDYAYNMYRDITGNDDVPEYFVTTLEIDPYDSIDVQAAFQKYIDHSISKTLNLPDGTSFEEYQNLFMYAYDKGLKGFTTFNPNGSMKGILEYSNKDSEEPIHTHHAPTRPSELPCDIHRVRAGRNSIIVIVGKLKNSLYELFVIDDPESKIDIETEKKTVVRKAGGGRYDLVYLNGSEEIKLQNFTKEFDSPNSSLARFISMSLRHGTPLQFVINQLQKDTNFTDFERSVARVLKNYIKDGEEVITSDGECPECKQRLTYADGCITCFNCGYSRCG
ncbi:MAG: adenosylcobalamin-dependent ribonucleoside-diphosphate reductase [Spirochaetales bacterium]|uniref:Vitamin B12-dependent ribonucleotide reductase n=1 Tax=Candidatus Thalassospirochaeta sargassi TaxID=3119039 RepID=A0AAJ1IDQ9_9SPIO|nr:adenosylcobalamin-dependent ribonucleoside-diphosphate reductase [Spirochaetales bacterium]